MLRRDIEHSNVRVQRPRSSFPAANVRAAVATVAERSPAPAGCAGHEEDLAAGSGYQDAASPRGNGRASGTVGGREDARGSVQVSGINRCCIPGTTRTSP
ncbi:chromosomal replication initiation protein [Lasius niger]|uniref:Chromosomal replication initiation protein n=1 Tax=Lasius niger TaxID=67767 RepID=A0A0J7KVL3_LASNI|nr:chromosomal replication initiation protein [Lasius niger]